MVSVVSVFPLLHPCAIRFPGSKTQKSSLTCFQWPIFSPCWTHVYAFTVPSFSLVAPCCTHVSFRFSVSKTEKSYLTCVQWRIFCLPFVPLMCHWNFRGQNPYLNQKQENTECFQTCFFNHFCLNHFPVNKNDRSETVLHILAISHFSAVLPRCVLLLCCSPRCHWAPMELIRPALLPRRSDPPKNHHSAEGERSPCATPRDPWGSKNWHEIHETGPLHGMYTLQSQHMCYVNIPQISPKSYLMCPKPSLYHWKPWTEVSFIWLIEPHVMR